MTSHLHMSRLRSRERFVKDFPYSELWGFLYRTLYVQTSVRECRLQYAQHAPHSVPPQHASYKPQCWFSASFWAALPMTRPTV
jgi:hypothetical protein